jgi:hypothetical protein
MYGSQDRRVPDGMGRYGDAWGTLMCVRAIGASCDWAERVVGALGGAE